FLDGATNTGQHFQEIYTCIGNWKQVNGVTKGDVGVFVNLPFRVDTRRNAPQWKEIQHCDIGIVNQINFTIKYTLRSPLKVNNGRSCTFPTRSFTYTHTTQIVTPRRTAE